MSPLEVAPDLEVDLVASFEQDRRRSDVALRSLRSRGGRGAEGAEDLNECACSFGRQKAKTLRHGWTQMNTDEEICLLLDTAALVSLFLPRV
jgi:hypothetical protein